KEEQVAGRGVAREAALDLIRKIPRPTAVPGEGLLCDLLWSDPEQGTEGWAPNDRGISLTFGTDIVEQICDRLEIDLIVRAHQVVQDGYEFFAERRLVTIFSAPNYCGEFDNCGGVLSISQDLRCRFYVIKAFREADAFAMSPALV
ncbi:unnamed protein product, partial [Amoebophrya sp. A25]